MLMLCLFASSFSFPLSSLAYRYTGDSYTNGTNNAPAADINCSEFLPSLLQMKSLLAFVVKLIFFPTLSNDIAFSKTPE